MNSRQQRKLEAKRHNMARIEKQAYIEHYARHPEERHYSNRSKKEKAVILSALSAMTQQSI